MPGELDMTFALHGLTSRTIGDMPSLRNGEATVETRGGDTLVTIAKADVDGMAEHAFLAQIGVNAVMGRAVAPAMDACRVATFVSEREASLPVTYFARPGG